MEGIDGKCHWGSPIQTILRVFFPLILTTKLEDLKFIVNGLDIKEPNLIVNDETLINVHTEGSRER